MRSRISSNEWRQDMTCSVVSWTLLWLYLYYGLNDKKLTRLVIRLRSVSGLPLVPQRRRWRWLRRWVCWSFWRTFRTSPRYSRSRQIKVSSSSRLVVCSTPRRIYVKLWSSTGLFVEISEVSPRFVIVRSSARVEVVVRAARVVSPSWAVGGATRLPGAPVSLGRGTGCVAGSAVCLYKFNLEQEKTMA